MSGFCWPFLLAIWAAPRLGPRRLVVAGGLAAALGMALIATADNAATLALGVFIAGSSPGFSYTPLSEVIMRRVVEPAREKVYAWINAGTGFGVVVAGPVAIAAGRIGGWPGRALPPSRSFRCCGSAWC
jgi:MFS family permease